jgi:cystathionine gamma-synthase
MHHPLGATFTGSVHSVISSLPTQLDVIGYEEKWPDVIGRLKQGYPRFMRHHLVARVCAALSERHGCAGEVVIAVSRFDDARRLCAFAGGANRIVELDGLVAVCIAPDGFAEHRARAFLQHTGVQISSRHAEAWLLAHGLIDRVQDEPVNARGAEHIVDALSRWTEAPALLTNSGANAFYATYSAISAIQAARGRDIWIQLGWLYVDTSLVLERFHAGAAPINVEAVTDLTQLRRVLDQHGARVAGIVCEAPSNPLLETCDLAALRALAHAHGALVVLDPTVSSVVNVDVLPYCDVLVTSLTKYAARNADVLAGMIIVNPAGELADELRARIAPLATPLHARDAARLAHQVDDIAAFVAQVNANTAALTAHLERHPKIARVRHPLCTPSRANFERVVRSGGGAGAVISISLRDVMGPFFDALRVAKSASFGALFTIAAPFLYLAHYDLVSNDAGRSALIARDIDPDLIRVSVGVEPVDQLIEAFDEALG